MEIKAQDLRIGNLVVFPIYGIGQVSSIDAVFDMVERLGDCLEHKISQINPIPLTEEYLLIFGFVQWGDSNTYGNGKIIIHKRKRGWVINTKIPIMNSVHQLMNYSFAITGQELTIK